MPSFQHFTLIFVGRSGSGKGTQAELIIKELARQGCPEDKILYVETGKRFRQFLAGDNMAADQARTVMENGELQPAFLSITMWANVFVEELRPEHEHVLLDGSPRRLDEAKVLDQALTFFERKKPIVINVQVSETWARERLTARHRTDDARPGDIDKRFAWFARDVVPVIEWYRINPDYTFLEVNGEQTVEQVQSEIFAKLGLK